MAEEEKDETEYLKHCIHFDLYFYIPRGYKPLNGVPSKKTPTNTKGVILKAFTSGVFLVLFPLSFYSLSLKVIPQLITNESSLVFRLFWITTLITLLGFFPYTTKHLWNLVAQCKVAKGREGWLLTSIKVDPNLPHRNYSCQVLGLLGTAQPLASCRYAAIATSIIQI